MTAAEKTLLLDMSQYLDSQFKGQVSVCNWGAKSKDKNTIWAAEGLTSVEFLKIFKSERNFHMVQADSLEPEIEVNLAAKMLVAPNEFMNNPLNYILNPLVESKNEGIIYSQEFSMQEEKYDILEGIEQSVIEKTKSNSNSFIYDIQSISDELMTNAIFHAQENVENRKKYMEKGRIGNISIAIDDTRVVISCVDPHGKLLPEKLFERIYTCYTSEIAGTINQGKGGAGIGSFLIHGMSASYIVAVEENVKTIISCILPLKMSNRKRLGLSKNIHCLYLKESQHG